MAEVNGGMGCSFDCGLRAGGRGVRGGRGDVGEERLCAMKKRVLRLYEESLRSAGGECGRRRRGVDTPR